MEKVEKADKLLRQFPKGITASEFAKELGKQIRKEPYRRQTGYDQLNSLVLRGKAEKKGSLFYPKIAQSEKSSTEKPSKFGFFEWVKNRSEQKRVREEQQRKLLLAQRHTYLELIAKCNPQAQACKEWVEIEKKNRKELGLE